MFDFLHYSYQSYDYDVDKYGYDITQVYKIPLYKYNNQVAILVENRLKNN